jgi:hypothetical protein
VPRFLTTGKLKLLYLLALFQLLAGPLILLQIAAVCQLTVKEASHHGVVVAVEKAWSGDHLDVFAEVPDHQADKSRPSAPTSDPKGKLLKDKFPVTPWMATSFRITGIARHIPCPDWERMWTPAWPQAPPGPPPRA